MHLASSCAPMRASSALGSRLSTALTAPSPLRHTITTQARTASLSTRPTLTTSNSKYTPTTATTQLLASSSRRFNSTNSNSSSEAAATATATAAASASAKREVAKQLDWNSFFKLRASRRRYSLASSIAASAASTVVGVQVLSQQDLESLGAQVMGLDPFVVLGLATAACGAAGWLVGPFLGNAVWGLVYRRQKPAFTIKEKEFFDRIRRFRVDPSSNSIANPVPDYYGEKIGSVQGYRQWLKDQRAYNRKRRSFIV